MAGNHHEGSGSGDFMDETRRMPHPLAWKELPMQSLESTDPRILGQRIAESRKARGKTQEEVADFLECSRPTYIAIEKGDRPAKSDEILKLASFLGRNVHELVRPTEPVVDLQPHLRAVAEKMKGTDGKA